MQLRQEEFLKSDAGREDCTAGARTALAQEVLARTGRLRMSATGGSMLPAIAPGDVLCFRTPAAGDLVPGTVLLVRGAERLVVHRMVGRRGDAIVTRGDALAADDAPVDPADVIGVLVEQRRGQRSLHPGGRHWLRRQRIARWAIRGNPLAHRAFHRIALFALLFA
jgi:hypothetical protein